MVHLRRLAWSSALCVSLSAAVATTGAQKNGGKDAKDAPDAKRPQIRLKANPIISVSPAKVTLTAEIVGGANDFEEFYCPTVEWEWGDLTSSTFEADCDPYAAGKSTIKRRYTVEHRYKNSGAFKIVLRLKKGNRIVASANAQVQVRAGLGDPPAESR